jgi:hypothetical protein
MDEYFPEGELTPTVKMSKEELMKYEGEYRVNRYSHDDIFKIASLGGRIKVLAKDGELVATSDSETIHLLPRDQNTFRERDKSERFVFTEDEEGNIQYAFLGLLPIFALEKVAWVDQGDVHAFLFGFTVFITLLALFFWPIVAWTRNGYRPASVVTKRIPGLVKTIAWSNYFLLFLFILLTALSLSDPTQLVFGVPTVLKLALAFPLIMLATTLLMLIFLFRIFLDTDYSVRARFYYLLLSLVSLASLWQLNYWNFIGFNY